MKIGREQRRAFGEGLTARRMPWFRLGLGMIVGWLGTVGCVFTQDVLAKTTDPNPTIRFGFTITLRLRPLCLRRSNAKLAES